MSEIVVGQRLVVNTGYAYTGPKGGGMHDFRLLVEVSEVGEWNASWKLVKVLRETGRPRDGARDAPQVGGFSLRDLDELFAVGFLEPPEV